MCFHSLRNKIRVHPLGTPDSSPRYPTDSYHNLLSHCQWTGRTIPLSPQSCFEDLREVDNLTPHGAAWNTHHTQGGSTKELVCRTTHFHGEFFILSQELDDTSSYVFRLKSLMQKLQATSTRPYRCSAYVNPTLSICTHVCIRNDATRIPCKSLQWAL